MANFSRKSSRALRLYTVPKCSDIMTIKGRKKLRGKKTTGEVLREGEIIDTELELSEDSKAKLSFIFYRDAYPRIVVEINKAGKVYDSSGTELTRISESKYNQIKAAGILSEEEFNAKKADLLTKL